MIRGSSSTSLDYNEAIVKISAAYRSAVGDKQMDRIPQYLSEKQRTRGLSDSEIEAAIHPLFDYLDANNHTLSSYLTPSALQIVMAKIWKQILATIEDLIVPPLSDLPSDMQPLRDAELDAVLKWLKVSEPPTSSGRLMPEDHP
jgi:hypothetical protein